MLGQLLEDTFDGLAKAVANASPTLRAEEVGSIFEIGAGIARVRGLPSITSDELVQFDDGTYGIAINLDADEIGVILLGDSLHLAAGSRVLATGREADTPVGEGLLGRVIDATGSVMDRGSALAYSERWPIERSAPAIIDRAPVIVPLETGIKAVDAMIPIGRGQRELIVGDRQTGKSSVAVDTILNQCDKDVICIYCTIGRRATAVARVISTLRDTGALAYCIVVVASDNDPPGLRYITPYAATTMAEYFVAKGRDVLIVYDDLTCHARAYRELSLLLRRPPGREAYPGDIFYVHSRLLERATHLQEQCGGGSLTAFPIIETQAQDISGYIPTNLISITDGQIYLSPTLFNKGLLPAIDIGKSVSRVGGKTQYPTIRSEAADLRLAYSQFEELESFARYATRLDPETRATIEHGRRIREILKQPEHDPLRVCEQAAILKVVNAGIFDALKIEDVCVAESLFRKQLLEEYPALCAALDTGADISLAHWQQVLDLASSTVAVMIQQP